MGIFFATNALACHRGTPHGSLGAYGCWHLEENRAHPVSFDLSGVSDYEQTRRRGDPLLCETLRTGISVVADGKYIYAWEGNCKDAGGCLVRIINWFNGQQVLAVGVRVCTQTINDQGFGCSNPGRTHI